MVSALFSNFSLIGFTVLEIERSSYFGILAWIAYLRLLLFPQMTLYIVVNPKRHLLVRKHVVWALKCKNRSNGSTWVRARRKGQDNWTAKKTHKCVMFHLVGEKTPPNRFSPKFVCWLRLKVSKVTILQGSNFRFSYWFLRVPYNSVAILRCLW